MLALFLICLAFILIVIVAMAVGVLNGREPIKGSCGGLNRLGLRDGECPVCGDDPKRCDSQAGPEAAEAARAAVLGQDITKLPRP